MEYLKKRFEKGKVFQRMAGGMILSVALFFMLFLFAPMEIYLGNRDEFWYDAFLLLKMYIPTFLICTLITICFGFVAYMAEDKVYDIYLGLFFWILTGCYIQGNFLVKGLPPFDGTQVNWGDYRIEAIKSLVVWSILLAGVIALRFILKSEKYRKVIQYASLFLLAILIVTLTTIGISGKLLSKRTILKFTTKNEFLMSEDENFIILLLDAIDEQSFEQVMEKHPEYKEILSDFTAYDNALTGYPYTEHALPLMLSGEWYTNEGSFDEYKLRAYRDNEFFRKLREQGYELNFYDDNLNFELEEMNGDEFGNFTTAVAHYNLGDKVLFYKCQIKLVGFKYAPFILKKKCWFNPGLIQTDLTQVDGEDLFSWYNKAFYDDIHDKNIEMTGDKQFKLIHLYGAHVPFLYNEQVEEVDDADYYTCIESAMTVTEAYLDKLKEAGVYENSVIIILADHGYNAEGEAATTAQYYENAYGRQHPILFMKGRNESHEFRVSYAPVSYEKLPEAYFNLLFGKNASEAFVVKEGDDVIRRYIYYGRMDSAHMVEYEQRGYAGDLDSLVQTGSYYYK